LDEKGDYICTFAFPSSFEASLACVEPITFSVTDWWLMNVVDLLWLTWDDVEDTELFDWIGKAFVAELDGVARSVGGDYPYVYLNYAAGNQNPLRSYGAENLEFMQRVAEKYDPLGVFQEQVPGGFKVTKA
jgi:FAD/FMN-containing dehydrogenase